MATTAFAASGFSDVSEGDWHRNYVAYTVQNGIFNGVSESRFEPDRSITRGEAVTVMSRLYEKMTGESAGAAGESGFSDVNEGRYYAAPIAWAVEAGLVKGYPDGTFRPDAAIDRESFAVIMDRYLDYIGAELTESVDRLCGKNSSQPAVSEVNYADRDAVSSWAWDAVEYLSAYDVLNGVRRYDEASKTRVTDFQPDRTITRAEAAAVLTRVWQAVMYTEDTETKYDVIEFTFMGEETALLLNEQGWEIITEYSRYEELLGEVDAAFAENSDAQYTPLAVPLTAEYFETGALLAVERQVVGCPVNVMRLTDCAIGDSKAEITMFVDSHGSTAEVSGHLYLIQVPKTVTDAAINWANCVHQTSAVVAPA